MRRHKRGLDYYWNNRQTTEPERYIMPFRDIEVFQNDSSDMDLGLTLINFSEDNKNNVISCFNSNGIVGVYKKAKKK